ncbi:hypothetical protein L5515_015259 [Caenorhabditis briggsae]|uniref:Protein CBR-MES-6 n=1 Tax=Caenorhabditis briggsae TaxID=6238 RepID=A0AAE9DMW6_CAEBR|nr:hypothetical protein L3Y34_019130 [Caenorhabditis briggsae]UMM19813.1 hypothetical protein L5515_015259 [Caenorhabditis briggsae]
MAPSRRKTSRISSPNFKHDSTDTNSKDHPLKQFIGSSRLFEKPISSFYGCAFNPFISKNENPIAAAVGDEYISIYSFPQFQPEMVMKARIQLTNKDSLYTVAWCYDNLDPRNPHKIVTGGESGVVYVLDAATSSLDRQLVGHMDAVNDIRRSPKNSALVATASKDSTVRLFHIRSESCLVILGGHQAHLDSVISVDWSLDASMIVSCGHDHRVVGWNLTQNPIKRHLRRCLMIVDLGYKLGVVKSFQNEKQWELEKLYDLEGHSLIFCRPSHVISNVHHGTADCVRTVQLNNKTYVLSRNCGGDDQISLWRFGRMNESQRSVPSEKGFREDHTLLAKKKMIDGAAWFAKFDMDPVRKRWLCTTGDRGTVHFYDMRNQFNENPFQTIKANPKSVITRQVAFSPNGRIVLVVGDGGFVGRIDRMPASGPKAPKNIWKMIR